MGAPDNTKSISTANSLPPPTPVLSYSTLDWWLKHEDEIYALKSPSGYSLSDVCFAPAGPGTPCVIQSVSAWFGTDMSEWGEDGWEERLGDCAGRPGECLPDFGQPIDPKLVLGGANGKWLQAKSLVVTYVVSNSEDPKEIAKAEEWETTLRAYLQDVSARSMAEAGVKVAFSTGVSLEEELNKVGTFQNSLTAEHEHRCQDRCCQLLGHVPLHLSHTWWRYSPCALGRRGWYHPRIVGEHQAPSGHPGHQESARCRVFVSNIPG